MRTIPWLLLAAGLVLAFLYLPSCYFTQDDLQNLSYYLERPAETATANLFFWSSTRRPLGGLVYLLLYGAFGLQAAPYYLLGALIWGANLALSYLLLLRISRERLLAITTISLVGIHPLNRSLWFNFGTIYELLALLFLLLTFHAYLKARECSSRNPRLLYTLLALLSFLLALNSKETAAAIPLLLLSYEALFADHPAAGWRRWKIGLGRTLPFLALTFPYVLGKITGEEAFWRDNAAYQYQFDLTPLRNLVDYMGILFGSSHQLGNWALALCFLSSLPVALLLRKRLLAFGCCWSLATLLPVISLPRVWELFLYIPLLGVALCFAVSLYGLLNLVARSVPRLALPSWGSPVLWVAILVSLGFWSHSQVVAMYDTACTKAGTEWRIFAQNLTRAEPELPQRAAVSIEGAPLSDWRLAKLIQLLYGSGEIKVFFGPGQVSPLLKIPGYIPYLSAFDYSKGTLQRQAVGPGSLVKLDTRLAARRFVLPAARLDSRRLTAGIAVLNPFANEASVEYIVRSGEGVVVARASEVIASRGEALHMFDRLNPEKEPDWIGTLELDSNAPLLAAAVWLNPGGVSSVPLNPHNPGKRLVFPYIENGRGIGTVVALANLSASREATVRIRMFREDGRPLTLKTQRGPLGKTDFDLPPRGSTYFSTDGLGRRTRGQIEVSAGETVTGMVILQGDFGVFALDPASSATRTQVGVEVDKRKRETVGVALANPSDSPVRVKVELSERGQPIKKNFVELAGRGRTTLFTDILLPTGKTVTAFQGQLTLEAPAAFRFTAFRYTPYRFTVLHQGPH